MISRSRRQNRDNERLADLASLAGSLSRVENSLERPRALVSRLTELLKPSRVCWCEIPEGGRPPRLLFADGRLVAAPDPSAVMAAASGSSSDPALATGEWRGRTIVAWPATGRPRALLILETLADELSQTDRDLMIALMAVAGTSGDVDTGPPAPQLEPLVRLGEASGSLVHELKSPLGGILATLQVLRRRLRDDERSLEVVHLVEREVERLRDRVVNILGFIRADREPTTLGSLQQVVHQAVAAARAELDEAGIVLDLDLSDDVPTVSCDIHPMRQAVLNLLTNAREAMTTGGRLRVSLRADVAQDPPGAVLTVDDTGCGFQDQVLERAFEPFVTSKTLGTGLGLANVARIVRDHGGRVEVSNLQGGGARATVILPLVPRSPQ